MLARSRHQPPVLSRKEWEVFPIGETGLRQDEAEALLKTAERSARTMRLPEGAVLQRVVGGLKAGQVCGVLIHQGRTIEILPKIDGSSADSRMALIRMLSVVNDLRVSDGELANLQTQRKDFLELLIAIFARRVTNAIKSGLQRRYNGHEEELTLIRGTLDVGRQLSLRPVAPTKLFCRFDELSENTPLNRLLKAAAQYLFRLSRSVETQRHLQIILDIFRDVGVSTNPLRERIEMDRSAAAFTDIVPLARLLLSGEWQNTTAGGTTGTALLFPMNDLFERYIARRAQQTLGRSHVHKQHFQHHALSDKLFRLIPDLVIEYAHEPVIIDTKWKQLDPHDPKLGVDQGDVYQMLAYGHSYSTGPIRPRLVLLYPHHQKLERSEGVLRQWAVTGSELPLSIATVDISTRRTPEQWQAFFAQVAPNPVPQVIAKVAAG
jgi:5-methylcytosine-specific restriction enzyme subunit McrC